MLATTHALVAGAIAAKTQDPMTAIGLSFVSHFILDAIPHWDFGTDWRKRAKWDTGVIAIADTIIGIGLGMILFAHQAPLPLLFFAIVASMLPDWMEAPWYIFFAAPDKKEPGAHASLLERLCFRIYKLENTVHTKAPFPFGIFTQIVIVGFFFLLLA